MPSAKSQQSGGQKQLEKIKPEIRRNLITYLKKTGPNIKKFGQGAIMGGFLATIVSPLAGLEAGIAARSPSPAPPCSQRSSRIASAGPWCAWRISRQSR